jgi:hypothetical protein
MRDLVLYCKSYHTDVKRVARLLRSAKQNNLDRIPFYVSVAQAELPLFQEHLSGLGAELLADEDILRASPRIDLEQVRSMPGSLSQQVVKSEFWRLGLSNAYLCLDSDSIFIRPFATSDYLDSDGTPYSVINEAHDLLTLSLTLGKTQVIDNFRREAQQVQERFNRQGKPYSFGPMPMVWHRLVWESLDQHYLQPQSIDFAKAIQLAPLESRWYGEALLKYKAINLLPTEPFFKVYHYAWQLDQDRRNKQGLKEIAQLYSGVIYQSSWEREMDWPKEGGNWLSRSGRRLRRRLGRI